MAELSPKADPEKLSAIQLYHRFRFVVERLQLGNEYAAAECDGCHAEAALSDLKDIRADLSDAHAFLNELPASWPLRRATRKALEKAHTVFASASVPAECAYIDAQYTEVIRIAGAAIDRMTEKILDDFIDLAAEMGAELEVAGSDTVPNARLPKIVITAQGAEVQFDGEIYADVDQRAAEALKVLVDAHPHAIGLSKLIGDHPERAVAKLPDRLRERCKNDGPGKGYRFCLS